MDIGTLTGAISIEDQVSEQLTEIANKVREFAKEFDGAIGGLGVGIAVVGTAILGMAVSIEELGKEGSKILGVENAFDRLAEQAGTTGAALREGLSEGVKGTVTEFQLMESTARLLSSGMKLTTDQATLMGEAARALGKATGGDAASGLSIMSGALVTGRVRGLQQQIGLIDLAAGEKKFADSLGVTVGQLNEAGKLEGKRIAILDATQAYVDRLGVSELSFAEKIKRGQVAVAEWSESLAKSVASSADVNAALDAVGKALGEAFGSGKQSLMDLIVGGINAFARGVTAVVPYVVSFAEGVKTTFQALSPLLPLLVSGVAVWGAWTIGLVAVEVAEAAAGLAAWGLTAAVAALTSPFVLVTAAVYAAYEALKYFDLIDPLIAMLKSLASTVSDGVASAFDSLKTTFEDLKGVLQSVAESGFGRLVAAIGSLALDVLVFQVREGWQELKQLGSYLATAAAWIVNFGAKILFITTGLGSFQSVIDILTLGVGFFWEKLKAIWEVADEVAGALANMIGRVSAAVGIHAAAKTAVEGHGKALTDMQRDLESVGSVQGTTMDAINKESEALEENKAKYLNAGAAADKFKAAVAALVSGFEGESKATKEASAAIDQVIKSGNDDIDVRTRLVDAIDKQIAKHVALTAVQTAFYAENEALGARAIAREDAMAKGWDDYYQIVEKGQGDSLAAQVAGIEKWYNTQYAAVEKIAAKNVDEWARLAPINAQYYAKLDAAGTAYAQKQADLVDKTAKEWNDYYGIVKRLSGDSVGAQLDSIDQWYDAELSAIEKAAKADEAEWARLGPLNALFWAKQTQVRVDAERAAAARIRTEQEQLDDLIAQQSMSTADFQVTQIWRVVERQIEADALIGRTDEILNAKRRELAEAQTDAAYVDNKVLQDSTYGALQAIADKNATTYDMMAADPDNYSKVAIRKAWDTYKASQDAASGVEDVWGQTLSILATEFTQLGQIGGAAFGEIMKAAGGVVVGLQAAQKANEKTGGSFGIMNDAIDSDADSTDRFASALASSAVIAQGASAVWEATASKATAASNALSGAAAGAKAGASFGPLGMAIGAAGGLIVGLIRGKPDWAKAADEVGRDFGVKISDSLAKAIDDSAKSDFGGSRQAANINALWDIIKQGGGLAASNLSVMTARLRDVFVMVGTNQMTLTQGAKVLDENFSQFAVTGTDKIGLLDKSLVELITLNDQFGTSSKAIADYVGGQLTNAQKGFSVALGVTSDAYATLSDLQAKNADLQSQVAGATGSSLDKINADIAANNAAMLVQQGIIDATGIKSQGAATAIAASLAGLVASNVAAGMSFIDAVRAVGPDVEALEKQLDKTGFTGGAAFDFIKEEVALANDKIAGPALTAVEGYTAGMVGLANAGILNQDTFAGLSGQIAGTERALEAQGYSGSAIMLAMKGDLQTVWELQQKYGYKVDDTTQALIDQGVQSGLIGEQGKTDNQKILDVLMAIGEALGAVIPEGLKNMSKAATDAASTITGPTGLKKITDALDGAGGLKDKLDDGSAEWQIWKNAATTATGDAQSALNNLKVPSLPDIRINVIGTYSDNRPTGPDVEQPSYASGGGRVTPEGVQYLAGGGPVGNVLTPTPWPSRGTDTEAAMLSVGESVTPAPEVQAQTEILRELVKAQQTTQQAIAGLNRTMKRQPKDIGSAVKSAIVLMPR